jgi:hypothetical protein
MSKRTRDFSDKPLTDRDIRRFVVRDLRIAGLGRRTIVAEILNFDGFMDRHSITFSQKHLAESLGIEIKTVKRAIVEAERLGYFSIDSRKGAPTAAHIDWNTIQSWVIESIKLGHPVPQVRSSGPSSYGTKSVSYALMTNKEGRTTKELKEYYKERESFSKTENSSHSIVGEVGTHVS